MSDIFNPPGFAPVTVANFASLPAAAGNGGLICKVLGLGVGGFSYWVSTGAIWKPWASGVTIASRVGTQAAPIASLPSTLVLQYFTLPDDIVLPLGSLYSGRYLEIFAAFLCVRNGTGSTFPTVLLENTSTGAVQVWRSGGATNGVLYVAPVIYPTSTVSNSRQITRFQGYSGGGLVLPTAVNIANNVEDTRVRFGAYSSGSGTGDSYALLAYSVVLR